MLIIGLTGGIGSGKTAVSDAFAKRGVPIIDTDLIAREVVTPDQPALAEIVAQFGPACVDSQGRLDRAYLRRVVFAEPALRHRLENILHPRIGQALRERLAVIKASYCLVVVPLLVETGMTDMAHRILVVDVPEAFQIQRVMARDKVTEDQARRVISAQASRAQRLALADDVIDNSKDLATLDIQVAALHEKYIALADADDYRPVAAVK